MKPESFIKYLTNKFIILFSIHVILTTMFERYSRKLAVETAGIRPMYPACINVWITDIGNYRYPFEKIVECPAQYGKTDPTCPLLNKGLSSKSPVLSVTNSLNSITVKLILHTQMSVHPLAIFYVWIKSLHFLSNGQFGLDWSTLNNVNASAQTIRDTMAYGQLIDAAAGIMREDSDIKNDTKLTDDIIDLIAFEIFLAHAITYSDDGGTFGEHKMTIEDIEKEINLCSWSWGPFLTLFACQIPNGDQIINNDNNNINNLSSKCKTTITNYLGWLVVRSYGMKTVDAYREAHLKFEEVITGVSTATPRNQTCSRFVNEVYEFATVGEYAKHYFPEAAKTQLNMLMHEIIEAFEIKLKEITWMDPVTKTKALEKAKHVIHFIAYPDWVLSNENVDKFYKELVNNIDSKQEFIAKSLQYYTFLKRKRKPCSSRRRNVPAGMIYHKILWLLGETGTMPINYGSIGTIMGHELTHGFDDTGRKFDEMGNLKNWWENKTLNEYKDKAECFIKEYSNIFDKQAGLHINGELTLGENIADNGGIRRAFTAYKQHMNTSSVNYRLPGLEQYSSDQLFFLGYSNVSIIAVLIN
ncbi:Neprilysin-1 [Nymphon striatum]|nr:Neprilysin-1 [Nymphon striatum]